MGDADKKVYGRDSMTHRVGDADADVVNANKVACFFKITKKGGAQGQRQGAGAGGNLSGDTDTDTVATKGHKIVTSSMH